MFNQKAQAILIYNARLISKDRIINNSWVFIKGGKIAKSGRGKIPDLKNIEKINARNNFLSAGFIDLHIHGDIEKISQVQVKAGTTSFLLTLHADSIANTRKKIKEAKEEKLKGAQCLGFHLEGPFLNAQMAGAQPKKYLINPDVNSLRRLVIAAEGKIKIVTLACELKGGFKLIEFLKRQKIVAALGHTNSGFEQARQAVEAGSNYATHVFNRMGTVSARWPGVITEILLDERVYAEIIADGHHVHPALLKLLVKSKPVDKIVLVTDSVRAMDEKGIKLIRNFYRLEDFTIAGSNLTMIKAIENMVRFCGVALPQAVAMASLNPARVLGIQDKKGSIAQGKDADLVIFDDAFRVKLTVLGGVIFNKLVIPAG